MPPDQGKDAPDLDALIATEHHLRYNFRVDEALEAESDDRREKLLACLRDPSHFSSAGCARIFQELGYSIRRGAVDNWRVADRQENPDLQLSTRAQAATSRAGRTD